MAKLKCTEVAKMVALEGMQLMGGCRLHRRVRHGDAGAQGVGTSDLRRRQRDSARDHRQRVSVCRSTRRN